MEGGFWFANSYAEAAGRFLIACDDLREAGHKVVVLVNLSKGFREHVLYGEFVEGDTADKALVSNILQTHDIDTVIHFAAHTIVPESVENPLKYYSNNTCATRNLLESFV